MSRDCNALERIWERVGEEVYVIGDPAYRNERCAPHICCSYSRVLPLTAHQQRWNGRLAGARVGVEWAFGKIYALWSSLKFTPAMKAGSKPLAKEFMVCAILTNVHTCINGFNNISNNFGADPPRLDVYLSTPRPRGLSRAQQLVEDAREVVQ